MRSLSLLFEIRQPALRVGKLELLFRYECELLVDHGKTSRRTDCEMLLRMLLRELSFVR